MMSRHQPTVLLIGSSGQTGRRIVREFEREPGELRLRFGVRKQSDVEKMRAAGREAVHLDLDDPQTFAAALAGMDRLFLLTGYTVAMLHQSKILVDAARKARVSHIVHQGIFANWDSTDPLLAWHEMIEKYIEASGITWTHLHPNLFMENLTGITSVQGGAFPMFCGDRRVGWVALKDVAAAAAAALREGPERHGGQNYWLSTDVLSGPEVAEILSDTLGTPIRCDVKRTDDLKALLADPQSSMEPNYGAAVVEFMWQIIDGRMGYIGTVRDDVPFVTGRASTSFRQWATENRETLLRLAKG
jgi:NAD(P)H dehydrogenase (quinone)